MTDEQEHQASAQEIIDVLEGFVMSLKRQRTGFDCRYTLGTVADTSGSHCPPNDPCQRCLLERAERESERLRRVLAARVQWSDADVTLALERAREAGFEVSLVESALDDTR